MDSELNQMLVLRIQWAQTLFSGIDVGQTWLES